MRKCLRLHHRAFVASAVSAVSAFHVSACAVEPACDDGLACAPEPSTRADEGEVTAPGSGVSCSSHGRCEVGDAKQRCVCDPGFTGANCELPRFEWLVPNFFTSCGNAISGDGKVVVGRLAEGNRSSGRPYRWTKSTGAVLLTSPAEPVDFGEATDVNSDGSVVVGSAYLASKSGVFRWTQRSGIAIIGGSDQARVTANGTTVVGRWPFFRWTAASGFQDLPGFRDVLRVHGLSGDGTTIVGATNTSGAFRWTGTNGLQVVAPAGQTDSTATAVSADGGVVVGFYYKDAQQVAFKWNRNTGAQDIAVGGLTRSVPHSVTGDGTIVLGGSAEGGWIWSQTQGVRRISTILRGLGVDRSTLSGLDEATRSGSGALDISDDGKVITGCAFNGAGLQSFVARIAD